MKIDEPVGMLFIAVLQVFDRTFVFTQADVDSGEKVRRDKFLLRRAKKKKQDTRR